MNYKKVSFIGSILNLLLFIIKFIFGLISNSISLISDSINNLTDFLIVILSFIGVKISKKPADEKHPFGHQRVEYIIGLLLGLVIVVIGFEFFKNSITSIINKNYITFSYSLIIVLVISIIIKFIQFFIYRNYGLKTKSKTYISLSKDSFNDSLITLSILISFIIFKLFAFNLDSYLGIILSIYIIYSGIVQILDIIDVIIGVKPQKDLYIDVINIIKKNINVIDCHDLLIHNYGPNKTYLSVHISLSNELSLDEAHKILDEIEKDIFNNYNIITVTHIDPIDTNDKNLKIIKLKLESIISNINEEIKFYDLRLDSNNLSFDLEIPLNFKISKKEIINIIKDDLSLNYNLKIKVYDKLYES